MGCACARAQGVDVGGRASGRVVTERGADLSEAVWGNGVAAPKKRNPKTVRRREDKTGTMDQHHRHMATDPAPWWAQRCPAVRTPTHRPPAVRRRGVLSHLPQLCGVTSSSWACWKGRGQRPLPVNLHSPLLKLHNLVEFVHSHTTGTTSYRGCKGLSLKFSVPGHELRFFRPLETPLSPAPSNGH